MNDSIKEVEDLLAEFSVNSAEDTRGLIQSKALLAIALELNELNRVLKISNRIKEN